MRVHGGGIGLLERDVLDFSCNLNPFAPPSELLELLSSLPSEVFVRHPEPYPGELEGVLAEALGVDRDALAIIPGSVFGIHCAFWLFQAERVLVPVPTFNEYERVAGVFGVRVKRHTLREEMSFKLCLGELASEVEEGDLLFVCNPNNPTGYFFGVDEMEALVRWCAQKGASVVFDEAFVDFTEHASSTPRAVLPSENALILRSFTKSFSIPGVRVGYALGHPSVISRLRDMVPSWSITNVAVEVLKVVLRHLGELSHHRRVISGLRGELFEALKGMGFEPYPSSCNFLMVKSFLPSSVLSEGLLSRGVLVRVFPEYPWLDGFFRVCVRKNKENQRLVEALGELNEGL